MSSWVGAEEEPEFYKDIAPILWENCSNCHRPGQAGPFPLLSYEDTRKRSRQIKEVVEDAYMPPWHISSKHIAFKGDRRLTEKEKKTLYKWMEVGMPKGDPSSAPAKPVFADDWLAGKPDLVVTMPEPYEVYADGRDIYRNFVFPLKNKETLWLKAIEIRPSARSVVHHALYYADNSGRAVKMDAAEKEPGFRGMGFTQRLKPLGGWAVGGTAKMLPDGMAFEIPPNTDLVIQTHFHPSGKIEKEATSLGLYLTKEAPSIPFTGLQLPPRFGIYAGLRIPAGDPNFVIKDSFRLPVDSEAFGVSAHAHYLGKAMKMVATKPDGSTVELLKINDWDFNWQEGYLYKEPVFLPAGTRIDCSVVYDNSADNPANPSSPPKVVTWGPYSEDEMGSVTVRINPVNKDDINILRKELGYHEVASMGIASLRSKVSGNRKLSFFDRQVKSFDKNNDNQFEFEEKEELKEIIRKYNLGGGGRRINNSF